MKKSVADDLYAYLDFLEELGYAVTVSTSLLSDPRYYARNIRRHPLCLALKTSREAWDACIACHAEALAESKDGALFFSVCHAGVGEYVLPIGEVDQAGFISIGGYCGEKSDTDRLLRRTAERFGFSERELLELSSKTLEHRIPARERILAIAAPIRHMLALLAESRERLPALGRDDALLSRAIAYLEGHCHEELSLDLLADRLHIGKSTLCHLFRRRLGTTVGKYLGELRLDKARRLLRESRYPIGEIAYMVGYGDANYFSALFRRRFGETPRECRKRAEAVDSAPAL